MGKREAKKKENREAILEAANRVFSHKGVDSCHVRDIVQESGLSPGTFYNYFNSKDEIFNEWVAIVATELGTALHRAQRAARDGRGFFYDSLLAFLRVFTEDPVRLRVIARNQSPFRLQIKEGNARRILNHIERDMKTAMKRGMIPTAPTKIITYALFGAGLEVLAWVAEGETIPPVEELAADMADIFQGGVEKLAGRHRDPFKTE